MDVLGQIDSFIAQIDAAMNIEDVSLAIRKHMDQMGFERFSYQILRTREESQKAYYITGYPKEWSKHYIEQNYISYDIVSRHAATSLRPFSWLEIGPVRSFTKEQKKILNEASEFNLNSGGAVPIHGPGSAKAVFTVISSMSGEEFSKFFVSRQHELHLVATYAHEKLVALGVHEQLPPNFKLSPRESEILTWTARGKTAWEISQILSIAEDTVKAHLEHACVKLKTTNKTHATAIAVINRLIIP